MARDVCVEFIAGSHRWASGTHENFTTSDHDSNEESVPDVMSSRDEYDILGWTWSLVTVSRFMR